MFWINRTSSRRERRAAARSNRRRQMFRPLRLESLDSRCVLAAMSPLSDAIVAEPSSGDHSQIVVPTQPASNDLTAAPTAPFANNRIIVHVAGTLAGSVEIDVSPSSLPPLPQGDDGAVLPDNFCGLHVRKADSFHWFDLDGELVEAENHGDVLALDHDAYYGGVEFIGPVGKLAPSGEVVPTCGGQDSWYFPIPLSYGGNAPQFGAAVLVIDVIPGTTEIEFIDHEYEPVEPPDFFDDYEEIPGYEEWLQEVCEDIPEFCEPEDDPEGPGGGSNFPGVGDLMLNPDPIVDPPFGGLGFRDRPEPPELGFALHVLDVDPAPVSDADSIAVANDADKDNEELPSHADWLEKACEILAADRRSRARLA